MGIAKGANLKMVPSVDFFNDEYMLAGLQAIVDDIKTMKRTHRVNSAQPNPFWAVVNLSYGLGIDPNQQSDLLDKYRKKYLALVEEGALLVVSAGNFGPQGVMEYPGQFANEPAFADNMIVVGAVDVYGMRASFSQGGSLVKVWAPGVVEEVGGQMALLQCAGKIGNQWNEVFGTSFSAAQVAALAAYFYSSYASLRQGDPAKNVKAAIEGQGTYIHAPGGMQSIWNGQYGTSIC